MQYPSMIRRSLAITLALGLLLLGCTADSEPTPENPPATPQATAATPGPPQEQPAATAPQATAATAEGLTVFRGSTLYDDDQSQPSFAIRYDPAQWEMDESEDRPQLHHSEIAECSMMLGVGGTGAQEVETVALGGRDWTVYRLNDVRVDYAFDTNSNGTPHLFAVQFAPADEEACRSAAETVLATFEPLANGSSTE